MQPAYALFALTFADLAGTRLLADARMWGAQAAGWTALTQQVSANPTRGIVADSYPWLP